jgi:hypothetical protein
VLGIYIEQGGNRGSFGIKKTGYEPQPCYGIAFSGASAASRVGGFPSVVQVPGDCRVTLDDITAEVTAPAGTPGA